MTTETPTTTAAVTGADEQQLTAHDYDQWLTQNSFSARWARFWFAPCRTLWLNTPARQLPRALGLQPADKIMEIGCGYAGLLLYLHRKVGFTHALEGLDCSALMVERARAEVQARGMAGRIHLQQGLATQLPYPDASFDVVLNTYVIKHLSDATLAIMLKEVMRVLKPGGSLCVWEAAPSHLNFMQVWNMRLLQMGVSLVCLRTDAQLRAILETAGFTGLQPYGQGHFYFYYPPLRRAGFIARKPLSSEKQPL